MCFLNIISGITRLQISKMEKQSRKARLKEKPVEAQPLSLKSLPSIGPGTEIKKGVKRKRHSEPLSDYELHRLETISQNQAFLRSLQLPKITEARKPRAKPSYRGIAKEKPAEVHSVRKSLRLQKKKPSSPSLASTSTEFIDYNTVDRKPEGPIPLVAVNVDESFKLPKGLLKLWNEHIKHKQDLPELKRYESVLQKMSIDANAVVKVVKGRIFSAAFHPCSSSLLMAAGDKYGHLGLWNLGGEWGDDGVLDFEPHVRPISYMAFSSQTSNLISVSYDGSARCMDLEKAVFEEVYRSDSGLKSFDFLSNDCSTLLIGHMDGDIVIVDRRTSGTSYESIHTLDPKALRTVHLHPVHKHYFVVAENRSVHIYDNRFLKKSNSHPVCELAGHSLSISSAYFSPCTGHRVLTTCMDNNIRVFDTSRIVTNAPLLNKSEHFMQTGRWLSKLSAVWDPKREDCFVIGSLVRPRRIQVFHESGRLLQSLQNEDHLTTVCSVTAFHPNTHAILGGNASGRLHVFSDH
ncbi:WD repeat-containing protein 76 isoform X2 [Hoplias malabaricus]|uniref:WD repeat-containing protein 76 isoform X2 n=1 Tax=Hoplias malabaricus TaxID=27720 RepID=UPI003461D5A3